MCRTSSGSSVKCEPKWPMPVIQARPPSYGLHQEIGWSYPMALPPGL